MAISNYTIFEATTLSSRLTTLAFTVTSHQAEVTITLEGDTLIDEVFFPDSGGHIVIDRLDEVVQPVLESIFCGTVVMVITEKSNAGVVIDTLSLATRAVLCKPKPDNTTLSSIDFLKYNALTASPRRHTFKGSGEYLYAYDYSGDATAKVLLWQSNATRWVQVTISGEAVDTYYRRYEVSYATIMQKLTAASVTLASGDYVICWEVSMDGRGAVFDLVQDNPPLSGFLFRNGFGRLEYFWCRGVVTQELKVERKEYEVSGVRRHYKVTAEGESTVQSGPLPDSMVPLWHDLMGSKEIYRIRQGVNQQLLQRVIVTADKSQWSSDYQSITKMEFSIMNAERMPMQTLRDAATAAFTFSAT